MLRLLTQKIVLGACVCLVLVQVVAEGQRLPVPSVPVEEEGTPGPEEELLKEPVYDPEKLEAFYNTRSVVPHRLKTEAERANELVRSGELTKAGQIYERILDEYPQSLFALSNLAVVRFRLQQFEEAAVLLETALKNAPDDAFCHSVLGICYYQMGKLDEAVKALNRSISLDPGDARTRNYMGIVSSKKGWWRAAEDECRRAIELDPSLSDGYYNLATIYAFRPSPDLSLARTFYAKALKAGHRAESEFEEMIGFER